MNLSATFFPALRPHAQAHARGPECVEVVVALGLGLAHRAARPSGVRVALFNRNVGAARAAGDQKQDVEITQGVLPFWTNISVYAA